MSSVEAVKATVRQGNHASQDGKATFGRAATEAAEASQQVRRTVHNSQNADVLASLDTLAKAADAVDRITGRYEAAVRHGNAFLAALG